MSHKFTAATCGKSWSECHRPVPWGTTLWNSWFMWQPCSFRVRVFSASIWAWNRTIQSLGRRLNTSALIGVTVSSSKRSVTSRWLLRVTESPKWRFWQDLQAETKNLGWNRCLWRPKARIHLSCLTRPVAKWDCRLFLVQSERTLRNIQSSAKQFENFWWAGIKEPGSWLEARITFKEVECSQQVVTWSNGGIYKSGSSWIQSDCGDCPVDGMTCFCREVKSTGTVCYK